MSIIVPVYNAARYLPSLIDNLNCQLSGEEEVLFIDNGSEDNSYSLMLELTAGKEDIIVLQEKTGGAASARQKGIDSARGLYITFIDSDDNIANTYLKNVRQIISTNPGCDMYVLSYHTFFSEKVILPRINNRSMYFDAKSYMQSVLKGKTIGGAEVSEKHVMLHCGIIFMMPGLLKEMEFALMWKTE